MRFANLHYLFIIIIIPLLIVFYCWVVYSKKQALLCFTGDHLLRQLTQSVSRYSQYVKMGLIIIGSFFIVLALIQPQWGYHWEEVKRKGLDIVIAFDVSKSMLAEDIKPNRLVAAKREVKSLINILKGDRIGIVAFAGTSFLYCPLTLDYGTAKLFLDNLDIDAIPLGGTDIGGAIRTATSAFEGHEKKHRVLILITDGEDHEAEVTAAVEDAKKAGIVIFPIGIGDKEGAPIPVVDEQGNKSFIKDKTGKVVLSKLNPMLLQKIALKTGGKKGSIGRGSFPLEEIYEDEVSQMERKELESSRQKRFENRYQIPLFIALICFVTEAIISERKGRGNLRWW